MTDQAENSDIPEQEEESSKVALYESIAEGLATLSDAIEAPSGVNLPASPFAAADVDFITGAWTSRLASVQDWMSFESELPESSHDAFLIALVKELGLREDEGLIQSGSQISISEDALSSLADRVETATKLQQQFLDSLDADGATKIAATASWANAWEEVDDDEPISPEPVRAKADTWPIYQLVDSPLNLTPSYQRGDVWSAPDRSALIESILRGIPLPSIILLRKKGSEPHEVVDGKQRLTTILRFVGAHPIALQKLDEVEARHPEGNLRQLFHEDYPAFRRAWKTLEGEPLTSARENEYYFPFKLRKGKESALKEGLQSLQDKYYCEIKDKEVAVADQDLQIFQLFTKPADYKIPVIEYTKAEPRQIHEVFKLYNKQGVQLNAEELRNAVYHELALTPATLFAAGDADPRISADEIAPFLSNIPSLGNLGATLSEYGFGNSRYKRTKVLSWIIAVLLNDTFDPDEGKRKPLTSTAKHIDNLLDKVQGDPNHPLNNESTLAKLFTWVARAAELHSGYSDDLWANTFKDGDAGVKWQELQLVGSLVGISLALLAYPDDLKERLAENADAIYSASATDWKRIDKAQNKTQWDYIRRIVTGLLELLDIDPVEVSDAVREVYGSSGLESLQIMVLPSVNS